MTTKRDLTKLCKEQGIDVEDLSLYGLIYTILYVLLKRTYPPQTKLDLNA